MFTTLLFGICADKVAHAPALGTALEKAMAQFGPYTRANQTLAVSAPIDMMPVATQWLIQVQLTRHLSDDMDLATDEPICIAVGKAIEGMITGGRVYVTMAHDDGSGIHASYLTPAPEVKKPEVQTLVMHYAKNVAEATQEFAAGKDVVWLPSPIPSMRGYHILVSPVHADYIANLRKLSNLRLVTPPAFKDVKVGEVHVATLYFETSMDPDAAPSLIDEMLLSAANGTQYTVHYA